MKLMTTKNLTILIILATMICFGCAETRECMGFNFYIEETQELIDGDIYLGDKYLGTTQNGRLDVDANELYPGEISIKGTYKNEPFAFYFDLYEEDIDYYDEIDYFIPLEDLEKLSFKATYVDTEKIEDEIFRLINYERSQRGITELKRSQILDEVAKEHSSDMIERDYYAHTDPEGHDVYDRLQSKNIFYFTATEDLTYLPVYPDTNAAEEAVSGWIESPGHRIPILDTDEPIIWDNIGIGVSCFDEKNVDGTVSPVCYVTAVFAGFESIHAGDLSRGYVQYIDLYNLDLGMDYETELTIDFTSNNKVDLYIVPNEEDYDKFLDREIIVDRIVYQKSIKAYSETLQIKPGYGMIIDASKSLHDAEYTLSLKYNP